MSIEIKADEIVNVQSGAFRERELLISVDNMDLEDFAQSNYEKILEYIDDDDIINYLNENGYELKED